MSALSKPLFKSSSAENPTDVVPAELVISITPIDYVDPVIAGQSRYHIVFQLQKPYDTVKWIYKVKATRDTAHAAILTAISTSTT